MKTVIVYVMQQSLFNNHKKTQFYNEKDFIVVYKPAGLRTTQLNANQQGLMEVLSDEIKSPLFLVFPMPEKTSGLILLAKNKEAATELKQIFQNEKLKTMPSPDLISQLDFKYRDQNFHFKLPDYFRLTGPESDLIQGFQNAWNQLNYLYQVEKNSCYRLIHQSSFQIQADIYGPVLWVYWYNERPISALEFEKIEKFAQQIEKKLILRHMLNRGTGVTHEVQSTLKTTPEAPAEWPAFEHGVQYLLKQNSGFSPGLFLDQSQNRFWIYNQSHEKNILNLFSYTSGFSVVSALGNAKLVTTVDVSPSFLDWSKANFKLNGLDLNSTEEKYEFFCQDVMLFLKGSQKRKRKWDLIICDPPSFGRSKNSVWKIDKDLPELALLLTECLTVNGSILFTCNY
jgi:23S rRNA (cytosine1962-C5)-methyltransferase